MTPLLDWLGARLREPSTWLGVAAFFASTGSALAAAGLTKAGLIVGALGAGFGGVGAFVTEEEQMRRLRMYVALKPAIAMTLGLSGCAGMQVTAPPQPTPASIIAADTAMAPLQAIGPTAVWSVGDYSVRAACHAYLNEAATQSSKLDLLGTGTGIVSGALSVANPLAGVAGTLAQAFLSAYRASGITPSPAASEIVEKQLDTYEAGVDAAPPIDAGLAMSEVDDLWYICSPGGIEEATMSALGGATVGLAGSQATSSLSARVLAIPALPARPVITINAR